MAISRVERGDLARRGSRPGAGSRRASGARRRAARARASQRRPALPNASVTGGRSQRLRASTPCASFFARVRARTSRSRRLVSRRSVRVRSSGVHTSSSSPAASSRASCRASRRSVFALRLADRASACACWRRRPGSRGAAAARRSCRHPSSPRARRRRSRPGSARTAPATRTRVAIRPADRTASSSAIATSQKSRCTSNPNQRMRASLSSSVSGSAAGHTTRTDSCSRHTGSSRRGGHEQRRARSSSVRSACPSAPPYEAPCPGSTMLPAGSDSSFMPRQRLRVSRLGKLPADATSTSARATPDPRRMPADQRRCRAPAADDPRGVLATILCPLAARPRLTGLRCDLVQYLQLLQPPPRPHRPHHQGSCPGEIVYGARKMEPR